MTRTPLLTTLVAAMVAFVAAFAVAFVLAAPQWDGVLVHDTGHHGVIGDQGGIPPPGQYVQTCDTPSTGPCPRPMPTVRVPWPTPTPGG